MYNYTMLFCSCVLIKIKHFMLWIPKPEHTSPKDGSLRTRGVVPGGDVGHTKISSWAICRMGHNDRAWEIQQHPALYHTNKVRMCAHLCSNIVILFEMFTCAFHRFMPVVLEDLC